MADWSGEAAYKQVANELRARIRDGRLPAGAQLPSIAALMDEFQVSVTVVRMALSELRSAGIVATHQGKGAFVLDPNAVGSGSELDDLREQIRRLTARVDALEGKRSSRAKS